jgi:transcriptional repressor NrdR
MKCRNCNSRTTEVLETREFNNNRIKRRRQCKRCNHKFTTYETIVLDPGNETPSAYMKSITRK